MRRFGLGSTPAGSNRPPRVASAPVSSRPPGSAYTADGSRGDASNSSGSTRPDSYRTAATVCDVPKSTPSADVLTRQDFTTRPVRSGSTEHLPAGVDHAEQVAVGVGEHHE